MSTGMPTETPGALPPPPTAYREYLEGELASEGERSIHGVLTQVVRYGVLKFGVVCFAAPFETARILRQVQWGSSTRDQEPEYEEELQTQELAPDFADEQERLSRSKGHLVGELYARNGQAEALALPSDIVRDPSGYLLPRRDAGAAMAASRWPLHLEKGGGRSIWGTMGTISRRQGLFSLWQGVTTTWTHEILMELGRAAVEEALESISLAHRLHVPRLDPLIEEEVVRPSLIAGLAEAIVGTLLAPLELARLRLIAQSIWPGERKYRSLWGTLSTIAAEEGGGRWSWWRHPGLAFTTHLLRPLLRILPVSLVNYYWAPSGEAAPLWLSVAWMGVQNVLLCAPLLVTLPLETIRRRLLVQSVLASRADATRPYVTRVKTAEPPYSGALNCLWRMVREEGLGALYQGWGMEVAGALASFATSLLAEYGEEDLGDDDEEL